MRRVLSLSTLYPNAHMPRFGTFVARQMEALAATGDWDVTVVNPIGVPPLPFGRYRALARAAISQEEAGVAVYRPRFTLLPAIGGAMNPAMIARAALPLARRLHANAPFDLVDAQFFYPDGPAAATIAAALGLPLSIKARGADISYWGAKDYARRKMQAAAAQAAGLLSVSEALASDMAAIGLPRDKVTVHYTGLDRDLFKPRSPQDSRERLAGSHGIPLREEERWLASVGALIPRKGQAFVIRALAQLPECRLLLVGTGPDLAMLQATGREYGVDDRLHFLGSLDHDDLPDVLNATDAMVLPSASEGLANAWVEALACGTPLVITDAGGAQELVKHDTAGRIVARTEGAIADGVRDVLAAGYRREAVSANAAAFSWDRNAAALADYYEGLIGGKTVARPPPPFT